MKSPLQATAPTCTPARTVASVCYGTCTPRPPTMHPCFLRCTGTGSHNFGRATPLLAAAASRNSPAPSLNPTPNPTLSLQSSSLPAGGSASRRQQRQVEARRPGLHVSRPTALLRLAMARTSSSSSKHSVAIIAYIQCTRPSCVHMHRC